MERLSKKDMLRLMGRVVGVHTVLRRVVQRNDHNREIIWAKTDLPETRPGWVIGRRSLQEGYVNYRSTSGTSFSLLSEPVDEDPPTLIQKNRVTALMVTFWPTEKPRFVPLDGFLEYQPGKEDEPWPSCWGHTKEENENWRRLSSDMSRDYPRDEKGRFVPEEQK